ncbi:hypothetical protein JXA88_12525 [Candidatus Fermentibacteria bacterium]|nr:hypothetical protein [Candidatus Fermentibacteria bacterium]
MNIAVVGPLDEESSGSLPFAKALRENGHDAVYVGVSPRQGRIEHHLVRDVDLAFFQGFPRLPLCLACALASQGVRMACPPLHTLALLDHPLQWRRVLEREGAPVRPWLLVGPGVEVSREPRVSVLGFPLRVTPPVPGSSKAMVVNDREELLAAASVLGGSRGIIVQRCAQGEVVSVFSGIRAERRLQGADLDEERAALVQGLASHIEWVLELAGPCVLSMVWEQGRLLLEDIALVGDLGPQGPAFGASGEKRYPRFVHNVVDMALRQSME